MIKFLLCCVSFLALAAVAAPVRAGEQPVNDRHVSHRAASVTQSAEDDCEARIGKLDASEAEGEDRLAEKNAVIDHCASQYKHDKAVERLVKECARYEEQPVIKQQFVADCQLAAFNYANALYTLKAEYGK